jgi:hypothetical protein
MPPLSNGSIIFSKFPYPLNGVIPEIKEKLEKSQATIGSMKNAFIPRAGAKSPWTKERDLYGHGKTRPSILRTLPLTFPPASLFSQRVNG